MKISSSVFADNTVLPVAYSCDGLGVNPPLAFSDVPEKAKSLALVVSDPDAPNATFIHWVVYNIPMTVHEVKENSVPEYAVEGLTSLNKPGFVAACPPSGQHRYIFTLYALDAMLETTGILDSKSLTDAMKDHILASSQLNGLYKRG